MIDVKLADNHFQPGQTITGKVSWDANSIRGPIEVRLIWYTAGKGTQDFEIIDYVEIAATETNVECDFSFVAPPWPFSCSGKLVSVVWAIECIDMATMEASRSEIVVAPNGTEIELQNSNASFSSNENRI
ncbi:MAG: hypothetical protein R3C03_18720 [Pirellulaceae bacterium]